MVKLRPTLADRARVNLCPNCGAVPERKSTRGPAPTFCSKECKVDHQNRHIVEGRALAALIKAWRIDRGTGEIAQAAFAQVCAIADQFNAADHAAGRPRADLYAAKMLADGSTFFDRQKR